MAVPTVFTLLKVSRILSDSECCFHRAGKLVAVRKQEISPILSAKALAGLLNCYTEFRVPVGEEFAYKPFPTNFGDTWLHKPTSRECLPEMTLFIRNPCFAKDWRLLPPGFDKPSGIYYAGESIEPREGTPHLDALLQDFCFSSPSDRTNYIAMLLTAVLMPHFIGCKPALLLNGNQPGLGKSVLAQIIAILRDGKHAETLTYNPNDEEFEKRIGAVVRSGTSTIIIDNAKTRGKNADIDSPCLERSITDMIISFRLLGQSVSISTENSHHFIITANAPNVSADIVSRSVVVDLKHEGDPKRRSFSIADPESYASDNRAALLSELLGMVQRWLSAGKPLSDVKTRFNKAGWGHIVGGILQANGDPDFLDNADSVAEALDTTRADFVELVKILVDHPQGVWTSASLTGLCRKSNLFPGQLAEGSARAISTRMGRIAGRFIDEKFPLTDGRVAKFTRCKGRKVTEYAVYIEYGCRTLR